MKCQALATFRRFCFLLLTSLLVSSVQANDKDFAIACLEGKVAEVFRYINERTANVKLNAYRWFLLPGVEGNNALELLNAQRAGFRVRIPALIFAVSGGNENVVGAFMRARGEIESCITLLGDTNDYGTVYKKELEFWTPLYEAVRMGHRDMINSFVAYGASLGSFGLPADSLFHLAARIGDTETIKVLIRNRAPFQENFSGENAFHEAARYGRIEIIKALLSELQALNVRQKQIPLFWDQPNDNMETPFFLAAMHGHADSASLLKEYGAYDSRPNKQGVTPLQMAATKGHCQTVRQLVESGTLDTDNGVAAALLAVRNGHPDIVSYLLNKNPDIDYQSAVIHAAKSGDTKMLQVLTEPRQHVEPVSGVVLGSALYWAVKNQKSLKSIQHLVEMGALLNIRDSEGNTSLHLAAGHPDVMEILANHNDFSHAARLVNSDGLTALHLAARHGNTQTIKLMLSFGDINVNATGARNETPLYEAVSNGHEKAMNLLLTHGADSTLKKRLPFLVGENPIECAIRKRLPDSTVSSLLRNAGRGTASIGLPAKAFGVLSGQLPLFPSRTASRVVETGVPLGPLPTASFPSDVYPVYTSGSKK